MQYTPTPRDLVSHLCTRVFHAVEPLYRHLNESEREALMEDFLIINYLLLDVHEKIEHLADVEVILINPNCADCTHGLVALGFCSPHSFCLKNWSKLPAGWEKAT